MDGWEFWIDVGGTFTDCIARSPSGVRHRHKTLSSGSIKGAVGDGSSTSQLIDPLRRADPPDFWLGWRLRLMDAHGQVVADRIVTAFDAERGCLQLDVPLDDLPRVGRIYELDAQLDATLVAIRYVLGCPLARPVPPVKVRLGTTRGTNALLTRQGASVAWVTTRGFADLLSIGHQARPKLFELSIRKPWPLYQRVLEIDERVAADGRVIAAPDPQRVREQLGELQGEGIESLAIGFLHAYAYPHHEQQVAAVAREMGFPEISVSSDQASLIKLLTRGNTTVLNAYLNPVFKRYLDRLAATLSADESHELRLMTSAGGLVAAGQFQGKDSVLSGPAGGVVGCAGVASGAGFSRAIGFDMGGTSTDVSRWDGQFQYEYETEKAGVPIAVPMLAIETVAAGGGSICRFDGVKLVVGPGSAGADPGPAAYGRNGPLTVTDINLHLGRLPANALPFPLDQDAVVGRLTQLCQTVRDACGIEYSLADLAAGFLQIANANMAQAIRSVSVAQGYDPRDYVLVAFGAAAPQHACAVARQLQIRQILDPPDGGVLSALGMGLADVTRHVQQGVYRRLNEVASTLESRFAQLEDEARELLAAERIVDAHVTLRRSLELRYQGTDWPVLIDASSPSVDVVQQFTQEHRRLYGYHHPDRELEVVVLRVEAIGHCSWSLPESVSAPTATPRAATTHSMLINGRRQTVPGYQRRQLNPGDRIAGPAIVLHETSTTVIDAGWSAEVLSQGELLLTDTLRDDNHATGTSSDPISLEIFNGHFESIARQMGITLRNTSSSVNVKERLDFSCALFARDGSLVVNAPHIPVHLGAMSETVKHLLHDHADLRPGDVLLTNDPFRGGSHLPDVTVVTPVFGGEPEELRFLVANRAHHAEIGGVTPGSMPPFSRSLAEEGVLIRSFKVVEQGRSRLDRLEQLLREAPYPTRDVKSNLADVRAQIAANQRGAGDLQRLVDHTGWPVVSSYMHHLQTAAEAKMRRALTAIPDGVYSFADHLDDGATIQVRIDIKADQARIDFTGTADVLPNNLNANLAIVTAAVMYSLRCLIDEPIPLNHGMLAPIDLIVPEGMLNPPARPRPEDCPAVAGGNVETSQRVVDVLLGALGVAAASQGTMNNVLLGNSQFGYYETLCGGAGATSVAPGADAVHTHMTNTRLTDPEILEQKYPLRVRWFAIRSGSGGAGQHAGGCGVVREFEFLAPLEVSLLSQRRGPYPPYGLAGGLAGQCGENCLRPAGESERKLPGSVHVHVGPGDVLTIATPGGGGYGAQ